MPPPPSAAEDGSLAIPKHIAIIMDGNGRWATRRGLPRLAGHRQGLEALKRVVTFCAEIGIQVLTVYAFSTENWRRPEAEISGLMALVREFFEQALESLHKNGVVLRQIGVPIDEDPRVPSFVVDAVQRATALTRNNPGLVLNIAFNYGGRSEIARAVREIATEDGPSALAGITEDMIQAHLDTGDYPDPDLILRTAGEQRLSNFMLWQAAYAEFAYTDRLWPDMDADAMIAVLQTFGKRERRFGALPGAVSKPAVSASGDRGAAPTASQKIASGSQVGLAKHRSDTVSSVLMPRLTSIGMLVAAFVAGLAVAVGWDM